MKSDQTDIDVLAVSPKVARQMLGCGNTRLYELLNAGEIKSYRDGGARKIVVASLYEFVARKVAESQKSASVGSG
ncbi:MAG: DNA-binding protein [Bradyrhizobiaceae bacterium]|nr:MAG: DNA-binding protein [Bradyrhizobiaceae bacterium]